MHAAHVHPGSVTYSNLKKMSVMLASHVIRLLTKRNDTASD